MEKNSKLEYVVITILLIAIIATGVLWFLHKRDENVKKLGEEDNKQTQNDDNKKKDPVNNDSDLNFDFLKLEYDKKNVIYSPLSIRKGLSLLQEGANGDTLSQLDSVLNKFKDYNVTNVDKKIGISNALFIKKGYEEAIKKEYIDSLTSKYKADLFYDDMSTPDNINNYVKEKTFDMIPKLFDDVSVSKIVLVNALAIDLDWEYPFEEGGSSSRKFYGKKELMVPTMFNSFRHISDIKYSKNDDLTIVSLPLETIENTSLEYVVLMPNDLDSYVKDITNESLNTSLSSLKNGKDVILNLFMPSYKFEYELKFKDDLIKLGLDKMFIEGSADFTKIAETGLYIDQAKHKAVIEVSEDGIKAAAATGFAFKDSAYVIEDKPVIIEINKPHLVIIRDKNSGDIWFVGTVYNPLGE